MTQKKKILVIGLVVIVAVVAIIVAMRDDGLNLSNVQTAPEPTEITESDVNAQRQKVQSEGNAPVENEADLKEIEDALNKQVENPPEE